MSRAVALIQARMSSTRFPGKVLQDLNGMPMIVFMVERARRASMLQDVVVVTSTDASDDPLAKALGVHGVPCFRGDLDDVLKRYAQAAAEYAADEFVRLTGDCPLVDPKIINIVVEARRRHGADYAGNVDPPTYPDGFDVEVFTSAALARADRHAQLPEDREHVTLWMRRSEAGLTRVNCRAIADFSALRLTVDYPDDLDAVRAVLAAMPTRALQCDLFDVLRCLSLREDISRMNLHKRNEAISAI